MKIALGHDSFTQGGGAERVFEAFHELYPTAPVYTTVVDSKYPGNIVGWNILTSPLQPIYTFYRHFQYLFPLIPIALYFVRIPADTTVFLTSSSSFAKAIRKPKGSVHISYCHTPTRFIWTDVDNAIRETPYIFKIFARVYLRWMRRWDLKAAKNVDIFIANSLEVQKRITEFYHRESIVVFPFVDTTKWTQSRPKQDYFLLSGRLQPHKQNEKVVEIFNDLGLPLHVVGTGRQEHYLRSIAKPNITFLGRVSDQALQDEYSGALAYVYPQLEDAGMSPLEAAACGTGTIALAAGGSLETVIPGVTGQLYSPGDYSQLKGIIKTWDHTIYKTESLTHHAEVFNKERFKKAIADIVAENSRI